MRTLLQWATSAPGDWIAVDSAAWPALPAKPLPVGGEAVDSSPGWVNRLNVQGVEFVADHYAVEHLGDACRVTCWYDDPDDYPAGEFYARVWTFRTLARDPRVGGRWNTRQSQTVYAAPDLMARLLAEAHGGGYENTVLRPWVEFSAPPTRVVRHGIWLPAPLYADHEGLARGTPHGWREWTEGVPESSVRNGQVIG